MTRYQKQQAFTLVEIMIVVGIIGLLVSIVVPSFMKSRETSQRTSCISNLRQIATAKDVYALENSSIVPALVELVPTYIKRMPVCPSGGTYSLNILALDPSCDIVGHVL